MEKTKTGTIRATEAGGRGAPDMRVMAVTDPVLHDYLTTLATGLHEPVEKVIQAVLVDAAARQCVEEQYFGKPLTTAFMVDREGKLALGAELFVELTRQYQRALTALLAREPKA